MSTQRGAATSENSWQFLKKSNTALPYDLGFLLLDIYPSGMKTDLHTKTCMWMVTAAFVVVVQLPSCVWLFAPCGPKHIRLPCPSLSLGVCPNSCPLSWWCHPTNHLILCCPLPLLPSIFSSSRVFSNELALLTKWPMYWRFSLSIRPSKEYLGLISFRIDWFDLFAVPGTLKSLLQHHNSKSSVLQHSVFFMVQLSFIINLSWKQHRCPSRGEQEASGAIPIQWHEIFSNKKQDKNNVDKS